MQHDLGLLLELCIAAVKVRPLSRRERAGVRGYGLSEDRDPSPGSLRDPTSPHRGEVKWVPCSRGAVKADHLAPNHLRAASSALVRSSGLACASASSSLRSPLPAVFATMCHFRPSILSAASGLATSTPAKRFCAIG